MKFTFISRPKSTGIWYIGSDVNLPVNTTNGVFKSSPIAYKKELKLYEVYLFFNMDEELYGKNFSFEATNELGKCVQYFTLIPELIFFVNFL